MRRHGSPADEAAMVKAGREARKKRRGSRPRQHALSVQKEHEPRSAIVRRACVKSGHNFAQGAWAILEALKSGLDTSV